MLVHEAQQMFYSNTTNQTCFLVTFAP